MAREPQAVSQALPRAGPFFSLVSVLWENRLPIQQNYCLGKDYRFCETHGSSPAWGPTSAVGKPRATMQSLGLWVSGGLLGAIRSGIRFWEWLRNREEGSWITNSVCTGGLFRVTPMVPFNGMILKPNKIDLGIFVQRQSPPRVSKFLETGNNSSMDTLFECKPAAPEPSPNCFHHWALKL